MKDLFPNIAKLIKALHKFFTEKPLSPWDEKPNFTVWRSVTVGTLGNAETARKLLKGVAVRIGHMCDNTLDRMTFGNEEATLDLVRVHPRKLGLFEDHVTTAKIHAAGARHGLSLCPAEVALQLLLSRPDTDLSPYAKDKLELIAMKPILGWTGKNLLFELRHNYGGRYFETQLGDPDRMWRIDSHYWVFVLNKENT